MQYLLGLGWVGKSIIATLFFVPILIAMGFFGKNFGIKAEVAIICYYAGIILGTLCLALPSRLLQTQDFKPWGALTALVLMGALLGAMGNILFFNALTEAPNPSLPAAMINLAPGLVLVFSVMLAQWLPQFFVASKLGWHHICGLTLAVVGIVLMSIQR